MNKYDFAEEKTSDNKTYTNICISVLHRGKNEFRINTVNVGFSLKGNSESCRESFQ